MGAFSDNLTGVGTSLLTKFGEVVSFTNSVQGVYDVSTGTTGAPVVTVYTGFGFPTSFSAVEIDPGMVLSSDVKLIVNKTSQPPTVDDTVAFSNKTYRVLGVQEIKAQGADIIYILQVRI